MVAVAIMTSFRPSRQPTLEAAELTGGLMIDLVEKRLLIDVVKFESDGCWRCIKVQFFALRSDAKRAAGPFAST